MIKIALVGNPNSGKSTFYNTLTGSNQYVGNWPGVTIEKKEGFLRGNDDVILSDLPGIYSLSPYSPEEVVARDFLIDERPDAIVNIIDGTNMERNLYLTTQLSELSIPLVVAINMSDVIEKSGDKIDIQGLSSMLGCKVFVISALSGDGCLDAVNEAVSLAKERSAEPTPQIFNDSIQQKLGAVSEIIREKTQEKSLISFYSLKLFERDGKVNERLDLSSQQKNKIEQIIKAAENEFDDDSESIIADGRYRFISGVMAKCVCKRGNGCALSEKIDRFATGRITALPIFAAVMFLLYYISVSTIGGFGTDWVNDTLFGEIIIPNTGEFLAAIGTAPWLASLTVDGIIGGVGAVIGFLPQLLVFFFLLALLEDCGYMARIAFILDKIFRKFGLSGKSVIPILIGTGCSVPGIMASRTIENDTDRKVCVITTSFMPCSAKLPIIALIAGALFPDSAWIAPMSYFIGIFAIMTSGIILKKFSGFSYSETPFMMELPNYHSPKLMSVLRHTWDRGKEFLIKAGTVIFISCALIWFLSSFNLKFEMVGADESILAFLGMNIAWIFSPLGFGNWQATVATISGLVAKESVVGTFGVLYGAAELSENGAEIWNALRQSFTPISGLSFMVFNLLCAPCIAAIGAISREMPNAKWTLFAVAYQTGFAYITALIVYQIGKLVI